MVSIGYLHLETGVGGYQYILVVMDHFKRYIQAYATRDKSAKTAADKLYNDFILRYGFPERIHHDQSAEFENKFFFNLEKVSGIKHSRTTTYHPEGNGRVCLICELRVCESASLRVASCESASCESASCESASCESASCESFPNFSNFGGKMTSSFWSQYFV